MSDAPGEAAAGRVWSTPAGVTLGPLDQIADPGARNYVLQIGDKRFHGFVVRRGGEAFGYVDRCPHAGLPLAQELDRYLTEDGGLISCSWHGALFEIATGACVGGPCVGARLSPWPVQVEDGRITTA
jgi:nitrite reductase/ring-hydroxylating ferredoxin subunit